MNKMVKKDLKSSLYMEVGYYKWNGISQEEKTIVLGLDIKDG